MRPTPSAFVGWRKNTPPAASARRTASSTTSAQQGVPGANGPSWTGTGAPVGLWLRRGRVGTRAGAVSRSGEVGYEEREDFSLGPAQHRTDAVRAVERALEQRGPELEGAAQPRDDVVRREGGDPVRRDLPRPLVVDLRQPEGRVAVAGVGRRPARASGLRLVGELVAEDGELEVLDPVEVPRQQLVPRQRSRLVEDAAARQVARLPHAEVRPTGVDGDESPRQGADGDGSPEGAAAVRVDGAL